MPPGQQMDGSFERLSKSIMDELLSWDPVYATQVGWHKYDWRLRDPRPEESARQVERCDELIQTLQGTPGSGLSAGEQLDRDLAIHLLRLRKFEVGRIKLLERESTACSEVGHALFLLSARDHPSLEQRIVAIIHRLEATPEFLKRSRQSLRNPYRSWIEANIEAGALVPELMNDIEKMASAKVEDHSTLERLRSATARASLAVREHNEWLRDEVLPKSLQTHSVSYDEYREYLEMRGYGLTADQALEVGEAFLEIVKRQMAEIAAQLTPSGRTADALDKMKSDHPSTFQEALKAYRDSSLRARAFVLETGLLSIPDGEQLLVIETPPFMRPMTPFAAQYEPGKFDGSRTGMFLVTPDDANPEYLREHSCASIENTTVHEGYPGHHVQGICSNTNPSFIRMLAASPDFSEGWGLYSEDLMIGLGYNDTPKGRLANLNDLLFRIVRLIVEVKLAKGAIEPAEGARMLEVECLVDPNAARIEARSCSMSPTYYSSYFIGKLAIMQLREEVQKAMGERFSLRFFHDALLYAGCLPMPFMRRALEIRLKEQYGIELGAPAESLYEYAMRRAAGGL